MFFKWILCVKAIQLNPNYFKQITKKVNQEKKRCYYAHNQNNKFLIKKRNTRKKIGSLFLKREACSLLRRRRRRRKERRCQMQKYKGRSSSLMKMTSENDVTNLWICKSYNKLIFDIDLLFLLCTLAVIFMFKQNIFLTFSYCLK